LNKGSGGGGGTHTHPHGEALWGQACSEHAQCKVLSRDGAQEHFWRVFFPNKGFRCSQREGHFEGALMEGADPEGLCLTQLQTVAPTLGGREPPKKFLPQLGKPHSIFMLCFILKMCSHWMPAGRALASLLDPCAASCLVHTAS
jgi:hypothetical protein